MILQIIWDNNISFQEITNTDVAVSDNLEAGFVNYLIGMVKKR